MTTARWARWPRSANCTEDHSVPRDDQGPVAEFLLLPGPSCVERVTRTSGPVWRTTLNKVLVLIPVLVLAARFVVFCEVDLARAEEVRYLPKWGMGDLLPGHRAHDCVRRDCLPGVREGPQAAPEMTIKETWGTA
jgi:hypothetical protein